MKYLVDTYGWIEWLADGHLAKKFEPFLIKTSALIVPTLIQFELYKWVCREKDATMALEVVGMTENGNVIPLDTNIALYAAEITKEFGLAMADAIIYATCKVNKAELITCDKHFKNLPQVKYFQK